MSTDHVVRVRMKREAIRSGDFGCEVLNTTVLSFGGTK